MDDLQHYVLNQPLPTEAFFTLVETTASLVGVSEKYWQTHGLNGARIRVLVEIAKRGGSILPSELASAIGVTKANISLLLTPLTKDGFITRTGDARDGRKTVISLTEKGEALLKEHLPGNRQAVAKAMQRLEPAEITELMTLLRKLTKE